MDQRQRRRALVRGVAFVAIALASLGCDLAPDPPSDRPTAGSPAITPVAFLTEAGATKIAFELAGWTDRGDARVIARRLTTWGEAPVLSTIVDRMPTSSDHPIWIIDLDAGPGTGLTDAGFSVILDAVDGHAIEVATSIE